MVATRVTVLSRSYRPDEQGWRWTSENAGGYEIEPAPLVPRGTQVIIQLKEDARDFAKGDHVKRLVQRYSSFIQFPIELNGSRLNTIQAIWSRNKSEITDGDYNAFYQYVGHDHEDPLLRLHFTADAPLAIQAVLFVPRHNLGEHGPRPDRTGREPLLPQGPHPGPRRGSLPGMAPLPEGRRRQRGSPAEHLAGDDAGQRAAEEAEHGTDGSLPEVPRGDRGEGRGALRHLLRRALAIHQGGCGDRFRAPRRARPAAPLRVVGDGEGQADVARGLRETDARRPEGDLLPARAQPRGRREQPVLRGVQVARLRGALSRRPVGRVRDGPPPPGRRQDAARRREGGARHRRAAGRRRARSARRKRERSPPGSSRSWATASVPFARRSAWSRAPPSWWTPTA